MNWAKLLPSAEYVYNNSQSSITKTTPFMALYSYYPKLQFDIRDNAIITGDILAVYNYVI